MAMDYLTLYAFDKLFLELTLLLELTKKPLEMAANRPQTNPTNKSINIYKKKEKRGISLLKKRERERAC